MTPEAWTFAGLTVTQVATVLVVWIKGRGVKRTVERVEHETQPNSGGSMRDAVNRTDVAVRILVRQVDKLTRRFDEHLDRRGD